ncbi:MAG: DUF4238 domain-containing protein [Coprobacillaceae bacterium]
MDNVITKKQHYVQQATIISNWSHNGMVGVIGKREQNNFRKEKNKSSKSIFYQLYGYELFTDFSGMSKHAENRSSLKSDDNHVFRINDAEKYCKIIEDKATPIIKNIINNSAFKYPVETILEYGDWCKLTDYIALQIIRTPRGRAEYFGYKEKIKINENTPVEIVDVKFRENFIYLIQMGVYDQTGIKDDRKLPESYFQILSKLLKKSKPKFYFIDNGKEEQFVLGDSPCVMIGSKRVDKFVMPLTPKLLLEIIPNDSYFWNRKIRREMATKEKIDKTNCREYLNSMNKVVYKYDIYNYENLKFKLNRAINNYQNDSNIWTIDKFEKIMTEKEKRL